MSRASFSRRDVAEDGPDEVLVPAMDPRRRLLSRCQVPTSRPIFPVLMAPPTAGSVRPTHARAKAVRKSPFIKDRTTEQTRVPTNKQESLHAACQISRVPTTPDTGGKTTCEADD